MCVAIRINELSEEDVRYRVLAHVIGDERNVHRADFNAIARNLGIKRQLVSYHVKKLVAAGYLKPTNNGYEPTDKLLFIEEEQKQNGKKEQKESGTQNGVA